MYITSKMSSKPRDTALQKQFLNAVKDGDVVKVTHLLKVSAKAQALALASPTGAAAAGATSSSGQPSPAVAQPSPATPQSPPAKARPTSASSPPPPDSEIIDLGFESIVSTPIVAAYQRTTQR
jgi:pyruvate/2-oxoglutarate dehydrogenase complex dihydrolipoamide acyltransferase (E2) component